jgi:hypothetical protein
MSDFSARIADARMNLEKDDFKSSLWTPEWDIPAGEEEAFEAPHPPQLLAALQVFAWLFVSTSKKVWVHLAAEMQAGKTGVIAAVGRLVLANAKRLGFTPSRIFVVTGMSDEAWQAQTAPRLPGILRENVHHGGTLSKVAEKLAHLAGDGELGNVLVFIDESHYATGASNQPAKYIYDAVARVCPRDRWVRNNIRFVTISATDPGKVIAQKASDMPTKTVRLYTTTAYQSVEKLQSLNRIRFLEQIPGNGMLHTETGFAAMSTAVRALEEEHGPLIHILRPSHGRGAAVALHLQTAFPDAIIHQWDVASNKEKLRKAKEEGSSGVGSVTDINKAILENEPETTTFVILKGMFRAAKTLKDKYVGVLYDRAGAADATNLQSLLGRACGYGKSTRSIIFTSQSTVSNYIRLWRELCASKDFPSEFENEAFPGITKGRMPGVSVVRSADGETSKLVTTKSHATPIGAGVGAATDEELKASARTEFDDNDFDVKWSEVFTSLEDAKANGAGALRPGPDGFYRNRTGRKGPMTRAQYMAVRAGKKTAHCAVPNGQTDYPLHRPTNATFAFYEDPEDPSTVRFVIKTLTRIRPSRR